MPLYFTLPSSLKADMLLAAVHYLRIGREKTVRVQARTHTTYTGISKYTVAHEVGIFYLFS